MSYQRDREEFIAAMCKCGAHAETARRILRYAATLARLHTEACNRPLTEREQRRIPRLEYLVQAALADARWERRGLDALTPETAHLDTGFGVKFNDDPRGAAVKIILPDGRYNSFGGPSEGWGVPTRG